MVAASRLPFSEPTDQDAMPVIGEELVQEIWTRLAGRVSRERIRRVAIEVAREYQDAKVTAFLPIFIQRQTLERLRHSAE
ncbi:hypothetical protein RY27_21540 [Litorilinea aerophila]|nr:hypothetical protein RY27_21540 [Litorilinea aerophila]GIV79671.1 MAG: hypothetical protein KatS3mg050_4065 [Litorilinea sp.]